MLTFIFLSKSETVMNETGLSIEPGRSKIVLFAVFVILILYLFVMAMLILRGRIRKQLWEGRGSYRAKEKTINKIYARTYHYLKIFPPTREYIEKLSYQFRLISPCDSRLIAERTVNICLIYFSTSISIFLVIFLMNPRLINLIISLFAMVIVNNEIVGHAAQKFEIKLDLENQQLIENQIHNYYLNFRVDDALYHSMDSLTPNMKIAAEQIYQLLLSDDKEIALKEYYENIPNKYMRENVSLCAGVVDRGDEIINGKHLFVKNLENLYTQLEIEIDKLQRIMMEFAGVKFIVILPAFCIDFVKRFCITIKSNMAPFYYGKEGFMIDIGLLIVIATVYVIMHKSAEFKAFHQSKHKWLFALDKVPFIKKAMDNYCDKYASKMERLKNLLKYNGYNIKPRHFILRNFIIALTVFVAGIGIGEYLNYTSRVKVIYADVTEVSMLTSAADEKQYEKMAEVIEKYTKRYTVEEAEAPKSKDELVTAIENDREFFNKMINEAVADEILRRFDKYHSAYFSFLDLLICVMASIIAFFIPQLLIKYTASVSKDTMEDEVNHFNALIGMLMHIRSMTVKQILIEMESCAMIFKQSLITCINNYGSGDIEALQRLKEDEPYPAFQRIVDNLIRCDDMPIYEAFHEVDVEMDGYLSKRKLANEKSIKKRVIRAYLLAAIPLILLFAYAVIPTLLSSMNEISSTMNSLDSAW